MLFDRLVSRLTLVALIVLLDACVGTPSVSGVAGTAPAPNTTWTPPRAQSPAAAPRPAAPAGLPKDIEQRVRNLTLTDIVDVALRNNPLTRISWENARAAAAAYGSQRGAYLPTIDGDVTGTRLKTVPSLGRVGAEQSVLAPSLSISYLLFDFGGRSGAVEGARQALLTADWTHNATIQDVVLQVQSAYFDYMAAKGLLVAQQTTLREAQTSLQAAEERRRAGVATIADVLQARTAVAQAQLAVDTTQGDLQTTRGALAVSMGLPANVPYDVATPPVEPSVPVVADSVDSLIATALRARPDLGAAQADFERALAVARQRRAERLPSLALTGTGGRTYTSSLPTGGNNYTISLGLSVPLFTGFSRLYNQRQAEAEAEAARAQATSLRQQVIFQVFSSYYTLQAATRRVRTADVLLASAQQSEQVALGRYKAGVGTVLDLLSAQAALADARFQQVRSRWVWHSALAQLAHDVGVLDVHGGTPFRLVHDTTQTIPPR